MSLCPDATKPTKPYVVALLNVAGQSCRLSELQLVKKLATTKSFSEGLSEARLDEMLATQGLTQGIYPNSSRALKCHLPTPNRANVAQRTSANDVNELNAGDSRRNALNSRKRELPVVLSNPRKPSNRTRIDRWTGRDAPLYASEAHFR